MFDLSADWSAIVGSLRTDPVLAGRVETDPGLRVPGCWNGFELATRAILGQQITVKGATALAGRIVKTFGRPLSAAAGLTHLFPTPEVLADANLASIGLTKARAETIRAFARAVCDGQISFEGIVDSDAFLTRLCEIHGVGEWTAQYVAMRALGSRMRFHPEISRFCAALGWPVLVSLSVAPKLGGRGEPTQPCTSGASPAKAEFGAANLFLPKPKKPLLKKPQPTSRSR